MGINVVSRIIDAMAAQPGADWTTDQLMVATSLTKDQIQTSISNNIAGPNCRFQRTGPGRVRLLPTDAKVAARQVNLVSGVHTGDTWNILAVTPRGLIAQDQSGAVYSATNPTMLEV